MVCHQRTISSISSQLGHISCQISVRCILCSLDVSTILLKIVFDSPGVCSNLKKVIYRFFGIFPRRSVCSREFLLFCSYFVVRSRVKLDRYPSFNITRRKSKTNYKSVVVSISLLFPLSSQHSATSIVATTGYKSLTIALNPRPFLYILIFY